MPRLIFTYFFIFLCNWAASQLYINEVMVSNTDSSENGFGHDWIELYNGSEEVVNLKGLALTDDSKNLQKWIFPNCNVEARSFLVIHLTGVDRKRIKGQYHASFKLKSNGEPLILSDSEGHILDQIPPISSSGGHSFGRVRDGSDQFEILSAPSPGQSNGSVSGILFSHPSGFYSAPFRLELSENSERTIFYTLDGSDPTPQSLRYEKGILLEDQTKNDSPILHKKFNPAQEQNPNGDVFKGNIIKAAAFQGGEQCSNIYVRSYFIHPEANQLFNGWNIVSLVADSSDFFDNLSGIYMPGKRRNKGKEHDANYFNRGKEWERSAHFTFLDQNRKILCEQHIGIRIHGSSTRRNLQKSFRLYARENGGFKRFNFHAFNKNERFNGKRLILRGVTGCRHHSLFKDLCTAVICDSMDMDIPKFSEVGTLVFLNGIYWGIYDLREHLDAQGLAERFGTVKDSVNLHYVGAGFRPNFADDWGNINGSLEKYKALYTFIADNDMSDSSNYSFVCSQLDMSCFIDYYCAQMFFNNQDWIKNNCKLWSNGVTGKFRFIFFDLDAAWISPEENTLEKFMDVEHEDKRAMPYATLFVRKLMESKRFQHAFSNRLCTLLNSTFSIARIDAVLKDFEKRYEPVVMGHIDRWGAYPKRMITWRYKFDLFREYVKKRHENIKKHFSIYLSGMAPCLD